MSSKPLFVTHIQASVNNPPYVKYMEWLGNRKALHLDIGAGMGQNVVYAETVGLRSVALEFDPDYANCIPTNTVVRGVAEKIPFCPNCFDVITLLHVLEHLPEYNQTLNEITRVIKPGGIFIVEVPNKYSLQELLNWIYVKWFSDKSTPHLGHCNFFTYKSLHALLEEHGLEIVDTRVTLGMFSSTYNSIIVNLLRIIRMMMKRRKLNESDYKIISKYQTRLSCKFLMIIDRKINQYTYKFVEFFGFVCIANKQ